MPQVIVLMGAPGAGKGTQARLLQERRGLPQISTGDIFRELAKSDSPLAREVRAIQASGRLISDDLVVRVVEERTSRDDCRGGYVLDGFPRTTAQAEMLEHLAAGQSNSIQAVLVDVPVAILEKRLTGRRSCPVCGEIYNIWFKPPRQDGVCDEHTDARLLHREDDAEDRIKVRLETYESQTRPLLEYYEASGRLGRVDGSQTAEDIYAGIMSVISDE